MKSLQVVLASHLRAPHLILRNLRWHRPRTISDLEMVFVVGAPRSGTTLLQQILGLHSELFSINRETGIFSARSIFDREHFGLSKQENQRLFRESRDIVDFFDRGIRLIMQQRGHGTFVEKTPQYVRRLPQLTTYFPKAKFIHIVRDGRDCACSARHHPNVRKGNRGMARYWRDCIRAAHTQANNSNVHTIRYEDFTASPQPRLDEIMSFLELKAEPDQLDPSAMGSDKRSRFKHFSRLASEVTPATVARWKQEMTPAEISSFESIAGTELGLHGYELQSRT